MEWWDCMTHNNKILKRFLSFPKEVSIETTGRCNAKCIFCPHETLDRKNKDMNDALFLKIISDLKEIPSDEVFYISPFKVNEPLMDKKIFDRIEMINKELPNAFIRFFSNFNIATEEHIRKLGNVKNLCQVWISLNSMEELEYRSTMGMDLNRTLNNIEKLLQFNYEHKITEKIVISRVCDGSKKDQEFVEKLYTRFKEYKNEIQPFLIQKAEWINHNKIEKSEYFENQPCFRWYELSITCIGEVAFCCMDGKCEYSLGNLMNESALDVYNKPRYKYLRENMPERKHFEPCKYCTYD